MDGELRQLLAGVFGVRPEKLSDSDSHKTLKKWDSVAHLQLIMALEQHYGIQIDTGEIPRMTSVAEIVRVLHEHGH